MKSYRCKNCCWFDQQHRTVAEMLPDYGYCRKHKPIIYQLENKYWGGWPLVDVNDFCGEFRQDEPDNPV